MKVIMPDIEAIKADEFFDEDTVLVGEDEARLVVTPEAVTVRLQAVHACANQRVESFRSACCSFQR